MDAGEDDKMQLTTGETTREIGARFKHRFGKLDVIVEIKDVKYAYGRKLFLVKVADQRSNFVWVRAPQVLLRENPKP